MEYIIFLIGIVCSNPMNYEKFSSEGSNKGIMIIRCENTLLDCYSYSGRIGYCMNELENL